MGPWRRGSASRSQREGRGSESRRLHQTVPPVARLTRHPCGQTLIMHWKKRWEGPSRPRFLPRAGGGVSRSPVRIRLGALGRRPRRLPPGGPGGQARGVMDASLCVGGAMASTAVSKTVDPGSSPGRRATPPSSFLAHRGFGSEGGWRRFRNVAQLAARAAGGREAAGSSPAIPTRENQARPSLPA